MAKAKALKFDLPTYVLARRMEEAGRLKRGQAVMLAATLPNAKPNKTKKGTKK